MDPGCHDVGLAEFIDPFIRPNLWGRFVSGEGLGFYRQVQQKFNKRNRSFLDYLHHLFFGGFEMNWRIQVGTIRYIYIRRSFSKKCLALFGNCYHERFVYQLRYPSKVPWWKETRIYVLSTLPETNIAPEINLPPKEMNLPTINFQELCQCQGG